MDSWSSALIAEGEAKGKAKAVLTYMRKNEVPLTDALDFFEVREPERTATVAWIEEHAATPVAHDEPENIKDGTTEPDVR